MRESELGDTSVLRKLFEHNTWANLKLLDFCKRLNDEQLDATAIGCFGSVRNTLLHIVGAEVSYVSRVNGKLPERPFQRGVFPGFDVLKDAARWTGHELLQLAISSRDDSIVRERPPHHSVEYKLSSLIVQSLSHSTEHRTQISAIITQLGIEPPDMSGWQWMDELGEIQKVA